MKMNNRSYQGQLQYNVIKIKTIRNRISLQIIVSKIMKANGKDIIILDQICNIFFQN